MPIPIILGVAAAIAGATGVGAGAHGAVKMKKASDKQKYAKEKYDRKKAQFDKQMDDTTAIMDDLGKLELNVLHSFEDFSDVIEKIQNKPDFQSFDKDGVEIPKYEEKAWKDASVGAGILLGGIGGAVAGTAGGFAAAGATTSAVMALGTASTGTAISSLSGVAATNATLAALGGGSLAAGGGGMALGSTILGAASLGASLLVGGVIFSVAGKKMSDKVNDVCAEMAKAVKNMDKISIYLKDLEFAAKGYKKVFEKVREKYLKHFGYIQYIVNELGKTDWNEFSEEEKLATQNMVLLAGLLYKMCQIKLVNQTEDKEGVNTVNEEEIEKMKMEAETVLAGVV